MTELDAITDKTKTVHQNVLLSLSLFCFLAETNFHASQLGIYETFIYILPCAL